MIDESHRRFTRDPGAPKAVHVRDPQTMKTQMRLFGLDEELLPPARGLERKLKGELLLFFDELLKQGPQRRWHRNGECPVFAALRRRKGDLFFDKIDAVQRDPGFANPATGVEGDVEGDLHPLRLRFQRLADLDDFL